MGVYCSALLANQLLPFYGALWRLDPVNSASREVSSVGSLVLTVAHAGLALLTFAVVREWVCRSGEPGPRRESLLGRGGALHQGMAAAAVYAAMLAAAQWVYRDVSARAGAPEPAYPFASGTLDDWLLAAAEASLAGVVEEPVYVGLLVVLWPRLRIRTVVALAVISSAARTVMHLYYVAGAQNVAVAIALVALWCSAWSTTALLLVYWTRHLWPVMLAHGVMDVAATGSAGADVLDVAVPHGVLHLPFYVVVLVGACCWVWPLRGRRLDGRSDVSSGDVAVDR